MRASDAVEGGMVEGGSKRVRGGEIMSCGSSSGMWENLINVSKFLINNIVDCSLEFSQL